MLLTLPFLAHAFTFIADNDKNRPVSRVVQLLKEMQEQLEKDQKNRRRGIRKNGMLVQEEWPGKVTGD